MTFKDYSLGKQAVGHWRKMSDADKLEKNNLQTFVESVIAVSAHSLSMDVKADRKRMALLITSIVFEIQEI